jgi:hypothetical protein
MRMLSWTLGLPASGKSVAARAAVTESRAAGRTAARVSADDVRDALGLPWGAGSDMVWAVARATILGMWEAGVEHVVWDATGAHLGHGILEALAADGGAVVSWEAGLDLTRVPAGVCVARDADRPLGLRVGADVIWEMAAARGWGGVTW